MRRSAEKRCHAGHLLPGAKAVIVLGISYGPAREEKGRPAGRALVARYARGEDYHVVIKERLKRVAAILEGEGGRVFLAVDTSPILEKGFARAGGLGWLGRNTLLIHPDFGSWILLGEIVTDLGLEPSTPVDEGCGECNICVEACPTGALSRKEGLEAERCISYQTIENRGEIPVSMRRAIGFNLFGCDVCQDVCPRNVGARGGSEPSFRPARELLFPDPIEHLRIIEENLIPEGSPLGRLKKSGLLRNLAVVMGNLAENRFLPHLERLASNESVLVREHALWALSKIRNQ
jgi:epoxyqueuosine reductase